LHYAGESGDAVGASAFVPRHEAKSMSPCTPRSDEVW
jgi:hypothetical protein